MQARPSRTGFSVCFSLFLIQFPEPYQNDTEPYHFDRVFLFFKFIKKNICNLRY